MIKCPNCGKRNPENNKFCGECGTDLSEAEIQCPNCEKMHKDGEKFCTDCGTKLVNQLEYKEKEKIRIEFENEKNRMHFVRANLDEKVKIIEEILRKSPVNIYTLLNRIYDGPNKYHSRSSKIRYLIEKYNYDQLKRLIDNAEQEIIDEKIKK